VERGNEGIVEYAKEDSKPQRTQTGQESQLSLPDCNGEYVPLPHEVQATKLKASPAVPAGQSSQFSWLASLWKRPSGQLVQLPVPLPTESSIKYVPRPQPLQLNSPSPLLVPLGQSEQMARPDMLPNLPACTRKKPNPRTHTHIQTHAHTHTHTHKHQTHTHTPVHTLSHTHTTHTYHIQKQTDTRMIGNEWIGDYERGEMRGLWTMRGKIASRNVDGPDKSRIPRFPTAVSMCLCHTQCTTAALFRRLLFQRDMRNTSAGWRHFGSDPVDSRYKCPCYFQLNLLANTCHVRSQNS
jgi:hypothetical protein